MAALGSCGRVQTQASARILRVWSWPNFFSTEAISSFEKKYACSVAIVNFETNEELFTQLDSNGGGVDVVTPSSYFIPVLAKSGLINEISDVASPHIFHVPGLKGADTMPSAFVPYTWSMSGILSLGSISPAAHLSWDVFNQPALAKKFSLLEDVREVFGAALKYLKASVNTVARPEIDRAHDVVTNWVKSCLFTANSQYTIGLEAGEIQMAHGFSADAWHASRTNPKFRFHVPVEGGVISVDGFAISSKSPNPGLAADFIRHMHIAESIAVNMDWSGLFSVERSALERASKLKEFVFSSNEEGLKKSEVLMDIGGEIDALNHIWQSLLEPR